MTPEFILSIGSALVSLVAGVFAFRKYDVERLTALKAARRNVGLDHARSAWAVVLHRKTAPGALRPALLDAFRLIDLGADGRRDFTDAQASVFLDEVAKEFGHG